MASSQEMAALAEQLLASDPFTTGNTLPVLPYPEPACHVIREHLISLSNSFSSFHGSTSPFIHNDGRSVILICVQGSICISNCTVTLSIWLMESYPHKAPIVYLSLPNGVDRAVKYEYVDSASMVSVPYLTNWEITESNLVDLVKYLEKLFLVYHPFCPGPDAKDDLILEITKFISKDMHDNEMEMKHLIQVQERNEMLTSCLGELELERDTMKHQLEVVTMNINLLKSWICENETKAVWKREDAEIGEMFQISGGKDVSDNLITDNAIEDTIYALDNALQEGCVPIDAYFKSIRALSREQFFHQEAQKKRSVEG